MIARLRSNGGEEKTRCVSKLFSKKRKFPMLTPPSQRTIDGFLPVFSQGLATVGRQVRSELSIERPIALDIADVVPKTNGESGQVGHAQRGGLGDDRPHDRDAK